MKDKEKLQNKLDPPTCDNCKDWPCKFSLFYKFASNDMGSYEAKYCKDWKRR